MDINIVIKGNALTKLLHYGALVKPATLKYTCSIFSSNFGHYLYINVGFKILMMMMMMMMMMMTTTMTMMMVMVRNSAHLLCFLI
jgi:hypothetical protein